VTVNCTRKILHEEVRHWVTKHMCFQNSVQCPVVGRQKNVVLARDVQEKKETNR
jgi:hypothetical protein